MTRRTSVKYTHLSFLALSALATVLGVAAESKADPPPKLGCALNGVVPVFGENYGYDADESWHVIQGDPLMIATGPEGEIGVWICQPEGSSPVPQYFSETAWASIVHFTPEGGEPAVYAAPYAQGEGAVLPFTAVTQTPATTGTEHKITTVVALSSDTELTRVVTYVEGSYSYKLHWELKNNGSVALNNLHFFHGGDTTFGGDDSARSWWNEGLNRVYVSNESFSRSGTMAFSGSGATPAVHHFGGDYWDGVEDAIAGLLPDTADSSYEDAGYQLQWDRSVLAPGQTWTIEAFESWSDPSFITVLAPGQQIVTPGSTVNLSFVVHNLDTDGHVFDLAAVSGLGWITSVTGDQTVTLEGLASQTVTVQVAVPQNAVGDSLDRITLTASEATLVLESSSAADLQVYLPQYTLAPATLNFGWVEVGQSSTLALTFHNTGSAAEIGDLALLAGIAAPFSVGESDCSGATIATGESCTINIIFTPTTPGSFTGDPEIPLFAPVVSTEIVHLQATGGAIPACDDGFKNGSESDEDCGGTCDPCGTGLDCNTNADCATNLCTSDVCAAPPACDDGDTNGDETDEDCGGSCGACANGMNCEVDADCDSTNCNEGECAAVVVVSCDDTEMNGTETDVDCGGDDCDPCANGKDCEADADCDSNNCASNVCEAVILPATCSDSDMNGTETDIDCGGNECGPCAADKACEVDTDCISDTCTSFICEAPIPAATCSDDEKNGTETDVDCGGDCDPCANGKACEASDDCDSTRCKSNVCTAVVVAACDDATLNGDETDTDCGGSCGPCATGKQCDIGADCDSSRCAQHVCEAVVTATCSDSVLNGDETDIDCGGDCAACIPGEKCQKNADCTSSVCTLGICTAVAAPTCSDEKLNGKETDVDCGGDCKACDTGNVCEASSDCASSRCKDEVCVGAAAVRAGTCSDGKKNGTETDVDCGGDCSPCQEPCAPEGVGFSGGGAGCSVSTAPTGDRSGLALVVAAMGAALMRRRRQRVSTQA